MSAQTVADVMTAEVVTAPSAATVRDVAQRMREHDIGDVLVVEGDQPVGLLTDRDLVVRALAEDGDLENTRAGEICSPDLVSVRPSTLVDEAIQVMRDAAVRRLPVIESGRLVGVLSLGDLASETDGGSALGQISQAGPNR